MSNVAEKAAVKRGVAFLDKADKGWEACIDLDTFDVVLPCRCVIGQVYVEAYDDACELLGIGTIRNQSRLGFDESILLSSLTYRGLQEEWVKAIKAKQRGR